MGNKKFSHIVTLGIIGIMIFSTSGCSKETTSNVKTTKSTTTASSATVASKATVAEVTTQDELIPEKGAKLVLWTDNEIYGNDIAKGFAEKYPEIEVKIEVFGTTEHSQKIEVSGPTGTGADVFFLQHDKLGSAVLSNIIVPFDEKVAQNLKDTIIEKAIKTATKDGKLYGAPISIESLALFYNKTIVDKPVETFEEMFAFAETFNNPAENKYAFVTDVSSAYKSYAFFTPYGFELFGKDGEDGNSPNFDSEGFIKGLDFVKSLNQILPMKSFEIKGEFANEQFKDGKVAYILEGPWKIEEYKKYGIDYGITTLPTLEGNKLSPFSGVQMASVSAYSKYPNAATLLAEYMASPAGANILYNDAYRLSALKDISIVEGLADDKDLKIFSEQFKTAFPMPNIKRMVYYWSIGETALATTFDGEVEPIVASQKAMEEWNSFISSEQ